MRSWLWALAALAAAIPALSIEGVAGQPERSDIPVEKKGIITDDGDVSLENYDFTTVKEDGSTEIYGLTTERQVLRMRHHKGIPPEEEGISTASENDDVSMEKYGTATEKEGVTTEHGSIPTEKYGVSTENYSLTTVTEGVSTENYSFTTAKEGVSTENYGFITAKEGVSTENTGFTTATEGVSTENYGFTTATEGVSTENYGFTTATEGVSTENTGFTTATEGVSTENYSFTAEKEGASAENYGSTTEISVVVADVTDDSISVEGLESATGKPQGELRLFNTAPPMEKRPGQQSSESSPSLTEIETTEDYASLGRVKQSTPESSLSWVTTTDEVSRVPLADTSSAPSTVVTEEPVSEIPLTYSSEKPEEVTLDAFPEYSTRPTRFSESFDETTPVWGEDNAQNSHLEGETTSHASSAQERDAEEERMTPRGQVEKRPAPQSASSEESKESAEHVVGPSPELGEAEEEVDPQEALENARQSLRRTLDQVLQEAEQWAREEALHADQYDDHEYEDADDAGEEGGLDTEDAIKKTRTDMRKVLEEMLTDSEQKALLEAMIAEGDGEDVDSNSVPEYPTVTVPEGSEQQRSRASGMDREDVPDEGTDNRFPGDLLTSSTTATPLREPAEVQTTTSPSSEVTPPTSTTERAGAEEDSLYHYLVVPLPTTTPSVAPPTKTATSGPSTASSLPAGIATIQDASPFPREVPVVDDVVESSVAAAKAVEADRKMWQVGSKQGPGDPDCPTAQPSPLRLPGLPNAAPNSENAQCVRDSRLLDRHLRNHTLWAVQMQDAGAGGITGLLEGNVYHLGDFDECMEVAGPVDAQYCVAEVRIHTPPRTSDHRHHPDFPADPMQSVWNLVKHEGEQWRLPLDSLHVAVCAPASCDPRDLQDSIQRALDEHADCARLPVAYTVSVPSALCTSARKQRPPFSTGEIAYFALITILILSVMAGTLIDIFATKKKGCARWLLLLFSLKRNWNMLMKNDPRPMGLDLDPLSGARTLNMMVLVLAHRGFNLLRGPVHNYNHFESMPRRLLHTGATHAQLFVDTCFAMSGLLVSLLELTKAHAATAAAATPGDKQNSGRPNLMAAVVHRYVRLTPSYALVVFFYASVFWRFGSGPLWDQVIGHESEACAKYWWTNLFYVNNYIDSDKLCMFQSWYLPCDLHMFFIGTALTLLLARHRRTGLAFVMVFLALSMLIPFFVTLLGRKPALLEMLPSLFRAPDQSDNFRTMYAPTHIRASPYMVGLLAGYLFQRLAMRYRERFTQGVTWLLCLGGVALTTGSLLSSVVFYDPDIEYSGLVTGLYAALCPVIWSTGVCIVFAGLVLGCRTPMSTFLSWKPFVVLSRLTYNVYLTHWAFQVASVAKARSPFHLDVYNLFYLAFGDLVASFTTSLVLFFLIEAPFRSLARRITTPPPESKVHLQASQDRGKQTSLEAGFTGAFPKR